MSRFQDLSKVINKLFHKDRNILPETIPPDNIAEGLAELADRLTYTAPEHSRRGEGLPPTMTFLKTGPPDELFTRIFAFCNCSNTRTASTPSIRH